MSYQNLMLDNIKLLADTFHCYLTAQNRVQIMCKESSNILQYCTVIWTGDYIVL